MEEPKIRELIKSDSKKYFKWINDRELVVFNSPYKPISQDEHNLWFEKISHDKNIKIFSIIIENDGIETNLIGSCSLRNIDYQSLNAELQIRIGEKDYQSRGYGTTVTKQLLNFGFNELNLNRIYLDVFESNKRARKVYAKCGFVEEGVKREGTFIEGKFEDIVLMSILSKEFYTNK